MSYWRKNPTSSLTKGLLKYNVISLAGGVFGLSDIQVEELANKAGLSMCFQNSSNSHTTTHMEINADNLLSKNFATDFNKLVSSYPGKLMNLCDIASVSDRMFRHIRNGKHLKKEPILALLVVMEQNLDKIQKLLKEAGYILSKSLPNDVVIMWLLENESLKFKGTSRVYYINETLNSLGLPLLMTRE